MKTTITIENAKTIIADTTSTKTQIALATFIRDTHGKTDTDAHAVADAMNKKALAIAVSSLWDGDAFKWDALVNGVKYPFVDADADTDADAVKEKTVLVRDVFCLRKTKNSTKSVLDSVMLSMVAQFGVNLGFAFADDHKDVVSMLKVYAKFTDAPKVFFGENPSSNNSLEKQLQVIADTMLGKDAVKVKKMHVAHAKDTFIRANKDGYKNGNEISLLQIIVDHIRDAKYGKVYKHDSKLISHKEIKEKKAK